MRAPAATASLDPPHAVDYAIAMRTASRTPLLLLLAVGFSACGSDSPTAPTPTPTPTTPAAGSLQPTLSSIQSVVFDASCISHHGDHEVEANLDLREGQAFANLVNVQSIQVALDLVEPNDAENSYLVHKLDGRAGIVGDRMPVGAPALSAADIDVIKQWINAGAQNN